MGRNKTIIPLIRTILCTLWHQLDTVNDMNQDLRRKQNGLGGSLPDISIDDAISVLMKAGYQTYSGKGYLKLERVGN